MPAVRLERLAKLAFDQIRQASVTTPAVLIRQLDAIRRLAPRLPNACRQTLSEEADAILETGSALVALDRRDLGAAHRRARGTLDEPSRRGEVALKAFHVGCFVRASGFPTRDRKWLGRNSLRPGASDPGRDLALASWF